MNETRDSLLAAIREKLGAKILRFQEKNARRCYVEVAPADIREAAELLFKELRFRFQIASGVDTPSGIEILYHFACDNLGFIVTIKTKVDRSRPEIDSVAGICVGAEWIEREMWELLGVHFKNHPDLRHLLLKDDWPEGQYPLRRDYQPQE